MKKPRISFGDLCHSRNNHFDFLRLVLSLAVLYSHSYVLTGRSQDAITRLTRNQTAASTFALFGFFVISGFLIAGSWDRSQSWIDFTARRARRIFPGFIVAVLFCFCLVGPLGSDSVTRYFQDPTAWRFISLLCMRVPERISTTFNSNPDPGMLNGSLWTIRLEISCYVLAALAGAIGVFRNRAVGVAIAVAAVIIWIASLWVATKFSGSFYVWGMAQMTVPFALGAAAYGWRNRITMSWGLFAASVVVLLITARTGGMTYAIWFAGTYLMLFVGLLPGDLRLLPRIGDLSYGIYLYAFPVQQLIVRWLHRPDPSTVIVIVTPITLVLAAISWNFVEAPWLHRPTARRRETSKSLPEIIELVS